MKNSIATRIIGFSKNNSYALVKLPTGSNPLCCEEETVYVNAKTLSDKKVGDTLDIPDGWSTVTKQYDNETMTFSDGKEIKFLSYA